jgi:hypothetical protein
MVSWLGGWRVTTTRGMMIDLESAYWESLYTSVYAGIRRHTLSHAVVRRPTIALVLVFVLVPIPVSTHAILIKQQLAPSDNRLRRRKVSPTELQCPGPDPGGEWGGQSAGGMNQDKSWWIPIGVGMSERN